MTEYIFPPNQDVLKNDSHRHALLMQVLKSSLTVMIFSIGLIIDGKATQYINEKKFICAPGSVSLLSPFDRHRYSTTEDLTIEHLCFNEDILFLDVWDSPDIDCTPYVVELSPEDFHVLLLNISLKGL